MLPTLARQILSMFPMPYTTDAELAAMPWPNGPILWLFREIDEPVTPEAYKRARDKVAEDRRILAVRYAINALHAGQRVDWRLVRETDPDNALYAYLRALEALRANADDARVLDSLRATGERARLYLTRQRGLAVAEFVAAGVSPRRAAVEAGRLPAAYRELHEEHRPVLRELAERLLERASASAAAGRKEDAVVARDAVLRLFSDLAGEEKSQVDVVTLAAECEIKALRAQLPGVAPRDEKRVRAIEGCVARWRGLAVADNVNVLPWTGDIVLSKAEHDRALRSLTSAVLCVGAWCVLSAIVLVSGIAALWGRSRHDLSTSCNSRGAWLGPTAVVAPLILVLLLLATVPLPFVWLLSAPTAPILPWLPWLVVALVGATVRVFVMLKPTTKGTGADPEAARIPVRALYVGAVFLVVVLLAGFLFLPFRYEPWRPPLSVQYIRKLGLLAGFTCLVLSMSWLTWGQVRRWRHGLRAGILARATLPVAARALLAVSVLSVAILAWNSRNDARHQAAFEAALADPISDRLGAGAADVLTNVTTTTRPAGSQPAAR